VESQALQALALRVGEATTTDEVFKRIVEGLATQDGVALARVWLIQATSARRAGCEKNVPTRLDASIWWPALAARGRFQLADGGSLFLD